MNSALARFFYKILSLLLSLSALVSAPKLPDTADLITPLNPQQVRLTAVLWGDPQVSDYQLARAAHFKAACTDVSQARILPDAVILAGDIAENGKGAEYLEAVNSLKLISDHTQVLPVFGNHDIRLKPFSQTLAAFQELIAAVNGNIKADALYYSYEINGYRFIMLGSASTMFEECDLSETELSWLKEQLDEATQNGAPVFITVHQPLKNSHDLPKAWNSPFNAAGSIGKQSEVLTKLLGNYPNVFLITGHLHSGLKEANFEQINGFCSVNLPSIGIVSKDGGLELAGCGYILEVYDQKVIFRARDFINGRYLPEYDKEFALSVANTEE